MYPQRTDTDRFHGIDDTYTYRLIDAAVSDGRITESDADLIRLYIAERKATKNIGVKRCYKIASSLIKKIHAEQSKRHEAYKLNSKRDLIIVLKSFYLWLFDNEEVSLPLKKIKALQPPGVDTNTKSAQDLLSTDEIQQFINTCSWSRGRALFFMMYEGGFRVGEIGCMKWGVSRPSGSSAPFPVREVNRSVSVYQHLTSLILCLNCCRSFMPPLRSAPAPRFTRRASVRLLLVDPPLRVSLGATYGSSPLRSPVTDCTSNDLRSASCFASCRSRFA
jgi:hypothetical protein